MGVPANVRIHVPNALTSKDREARKGHLQGLPLRYQISATRSHYGRDLFSHT